MNNQKNSHAQVPVLIMGAGFTMAMLETEGGGFCCSWAKLLEEVLRDTDLQRLLTGWNRDAFEALIKGSPSGIDLVAAAYLIKTGIKTNRSDDCDTNQIFGAALSRQIDKWAARFEKIEAVNSSDRKNESRRKQYDEWEQCLELIRRKIHEGKLRIATTNYDLFLERKLKMKCLTPPLILQDESDRKNGARVAINRISHRIREAELNQFGYVHPVERRNDGSGHGPKIVDPEDWDSREDAWLTACAWCDPGYFHEDDIKQLASILHLHGSIAVPETIVIDPTSYGECLLDSKDTRNVFRGLFSPGKKGADPAAIIWFGVSPSGLSDPHFDAIWTDLKATAYKEAAKILKNKNGQMDEARWKAAVNQKAKGILEQRSTLRNWVGREKEEADVKEVGRSILDSDLTFACYTFNNFTDAPKKLMSTIEEITER